MKKYLIFALVLCLALSLVACGRKDEEPTVTTTEPMVEPSILPTIIEPTLETNIPDTNVDDEHLNDWMEDTTTQPSNDIKSRINTVK